jgi:AraC family transcriptional regulator
MINFRLIERPAFEVIGKKTWIGEQDNDLFGRFWQECQSNGLLAALGKLRAGRSGPQTGGLLEGMESYRVPATQWAVFECRGKVPESIVQAEMFAFMEWLPNSGYEHALAPEMEVYPNQGDETCEFWLPIQLKGEAPS